MPDQQTPKSNLSAAEIARTPEVHVRHPFNPNSGVYLRQLARPVGLKRVALTIARIPPGRESFIYHCNERDEEFLYILSGRGRAEIADEVVEVGPGDFMGFPTPSVAHHLTNPYDEARLSHGRREQFLRHRQLSPDRPEIDLQRGKNLCGR
jgi:uncharacterized cupin superfamily protein